MEATDPQQGDQATAKDWQPGDSTASSSPFPVEQNGSESLESSKDEEADDQLSESPDNPSPQSSPASHPQPPSTRRETLLGTSLGKKEQVNRISLVLILEIIVYVTFSLLILHNSSFIVCALCECGLR